MVWRSQRDWLGSASQAPRNRTSGTNETTDIPRVGQRSGTQGPDSGISLPVRSGVGVWVALTCVLAEGAWVVRLVAFSNRPQVLTGKRRVWLKTGSSTTPIPSEDPEIVETALLSRFWVPLTVKPVAGKKKQKIIRPALLRGREWCIHHLSKSTYPHPWVACRHVLPGPGQTGRLPCSRLHGADLLEVAASAAREWRQQLRGGAGCAWLPQSASVQHRTAGRSSPPRCQRGRSGIRGNSRTVPCLPPSSRPDTATGGVPGPPWWTSHSPETAP